MKIFCGEILIFIGVLFLPACAQKPSASGCGQPRLRALLDVGSGSTKLNLSEVTLCEENSRVLRVIDDDSSVAVPLESSKNANAALSLEVQEAGVKAIAELRDKAFALARAQAPRYKSIEFAAVGTHAFRTASNPGEFAAKVRALDINLVALPQEKEGETAYLGVKQKGLPEECRGREPVVWDVGGGSQQITYADLQGRMHVLGIGFGAETFKTKLIAELHAPHITSRCPTTRPTPNPVGWKNSSRAEILAEHMANAATPKDFQLSNVTQCIIGVGGVHSKAIAAQAAKYWSRIKSCTCGENLSCSHTPNAYSRKELQCLALWLSDKTDCDAEISGPYASTSVSNLYMILGFMEDLKLNQVHTMNVNMGGNLVLDNTTLHWTTLALPPMPAQ